MVYTKTTRRIGRGRGRAGSRAVAAGLGPRGGVGQHDRVSSSHSSRHSRGAGNSSRDSTNVQRVESSQPNPVDDSAYDPTEGSYEYTPSTPTHENLEDVIPKLHGEIAELRVEVAKVRAEKEEVEGWLNNLQGEHVKLGGVLNKVLDVNEELSKNNNSLAKKYVELEWERRIVSRTLKIRLRDRARYYRRAASEYVGLIRGYFTGWAHQFQNGPSLGFIWNYRPASTYDEFVRISHYPMDMP